MSPTANRIAEVIPPGSGLVLDLGGGSGSLRPLLEQLGYSYINIDVQRFDNGEPSIIGNAHTLPFGDSVFDMVVSADTLEHFLQPQMVVKEVYRILVDGGRFIIWVPFMHPFHGDDFYRYTPLGLRHLLSNFEIVLFESPAWVFTVICTATVEALKRLHLGFVGRPIMLIGGGLDKWFTRRQVRPASFAAAYRIIAAKTGRS